MCLFPDLKMGITLEIFIFFGTSPVDSDWFIIRVRGNIIRSIDSFINLIDIPSCPLLV